MHGEFFAAWSSVTISGAFQLYSEVIISEAEVPCLLWDPQTVQEGRKPPCWKLQGPWETLEADSLLRCHDRSAQV